MKRKGYEHPEIVMKIVSVLFDDLSFGTEKGAEMEQYYQACKAYQDNRGQEKSWENWGGKKITEEVEKEVTSNE